MKRLIPFIAALLVGCASTPDQRAQQVENFAYAAASIGTQDTLALKPEYRPAFVAAESALGTQIVQSTLSGASLRSILNTLATDAKIKELKSPQAVLAIANATFLFDTVTGGNVDVSTNLIYVYAAGRGIYRGIGTGLTNSLPH